MTKQNEPDLEALTEKQVKAEERRLEDIVQFAEHVMVKCGDMLYNREVGNMGDRSEYAWVLNDFHNFDFQMDHGKVYVYGNSLTIDYTHSGEPSKTVFKVEYEGSFKVGESESKIIIYDKGPWEEKIAYLMKNKRKIIAAHKAGIKKAEAEEKAYERKAKKSHEKYLKKQELVQRAKDIKMV